MISSPTSIWTAVGQTKRYVSKKVGAAIWQRSFYDHVIRDNNDYEKIAKYIYENPVKWQYDCFYTEKQGHGLCRLAKNEEYYDENFINGTIDFTRLV